MATGTSDFVGHGPLGNVLADTRTSNVGAEEFRTLTMEMKHVDTTQPV
jgi:hypothetical protein